MNIRERFIKGVYTCECCERQTRGNADSADLDLCIECDDLLQADNEYNDRDRNPSPQEMAAHEKTLAVIAERGGNTEQVKDLCEYIWS